MDTYVAKTSPAEALHAAVSYFKGYAFAWWQVCVNKNEIQDWGTLREGLKVVFNPRNKIYAACDHLH